MKNVIRQQLGRLEQQEMEFDELVIRMRGIFGTKNIDIFHDYIKGCYLFVPYGGFVKGVLEVYFNVVNKKLFVAQICERF